MRNCLKDLRKAEEALVRSGHAEALSLDRPAGRDQSDGVFGDFVRSTAPRPDFLAPLAVSLAKIQERLSERQLQLLRGRLAGYEMTELAHQLGVHRDTLYEDLKRIQRAFFDEGLAPVGFDPTDRRSRS